MNILVMKKEIHSILRNDDRFFKVLFALERETLSRFYP